MQMPNTGVGRKPIRKVSSGMSLLRWTTRMLMAAAVILTLVAQGWSAEEGWVVSFQEAKEKAAKEGKDILIEFTGSDWCPPCKALKAKVLDTEVFKTKTPEKFILLKVDNPRDKSMQSDEEKAQYPKMAGEFKVSGVPTIILADASGRPYSKTVGYSGAEADQYVDDLIKKEEIRKKRDAAMAEAEKASGADKAKKLDEAISVIDGELAVSQYRGVVDEIIKLDADNAAGLKAKYEGTLKLGDVRAALTKIRQTAGPNNHQGVLDSVEKLLEEMKPTGEGLQEALILKALATMQIDKAKAKPIFEEAQKAAPDSQMAKQIQNFLTAQFKDQ